MNSFWIPSLGGQIMAMPGMTTQMNLMANTQGNFNGFSSNISGDGFAGMAFSAKSVSPADFAAWVSWVQKQHNDLNPATYATLAQPSEYNPVTYYSSVADGLFTASVMKYMMPAMEMTPSMANMNTMSGMEMGTTTP
jgi:cytochrome o ubiquinol oxidase subunit 2